MINEDSKKIRVRFAPSPTGSLHIGGLRTALYNYLFAKKNDGEMILRIEDTDRKRYVEGAVEGLIGSLGWAGIVWEEGAFRMDSAPDDARLKKEESKNYSNVVEIGDNGPYIQSERLDVYKKYADELVKSGQAYYCFCEPERLEKMRGKQIAEKKAPMYDRHCLTNVSQDEINDNLKNECPFVVRLKVPKGEVLEFDDIIRGKVKFNTDVIDDQVLLKSDGFPTYHLANVIDDHLMGISHVIRGEEWLPSTPKHVILYKAFGWKVPTFAHLPLLLSTERKKLSKRQGDVAVEDYVNKGYLKEAVVNFIALLGWNPGQGKTQEIFSLKELCDEFELSKVHKAGAVFDIKKLDWINSQYIRSMEARTLREKVLPFLSGKDFFIKSPEVCKSDEYLDKVLEIEKERLFKLSDICDGNKFFFDDLFLYEPSMLKWKEMSFEDVIAQLSKAETLLSSFSDDDWTRDMLAKVLLEGAGEDRGIFLWPLRVSLTGQQKSPSPSDVAWVVGKEESLRRIERAIALAKKEL